MTEPLMKEKCLYILLHSSICIAAEETCVHHYPKKTKGQHGNMPPLSSLFMALKSLRCKDEFTSVLQTVRTD